jgi:hypothetical protein
MSNAFAIAAVTAVLRRLLSVEIGSLGSFGSVQVTALPPDRMEVGATEPPRLNLFMVHATPNQGWRNVGLPSMGSAGQPMTNPPLALDLHYLLMAYGADEFTPEALLGYGMQVLHDTPVLTRPFIRDTWPPDGTPVERALAEAGLADQIELIKLCPQTLNTEELSKFWTATQSKYRPTAAYVASVVLIEGARPTRSPLPVLRQGKEDRGPFSVAPPFPSLSGVRPARFASLPAVQLGETLLILGEQLDGDVMVRLRHPRLDQPIDLAPGAERSATELPLQLPAPSGNVIANWRAGMHSLSLVTQRPDLPAWTTNEVPFALSPSVTVQRDDADDAPLSAAPGDTITLKVAPQIVDGQRWDVLFGMGSAPDATLTNPADPAELDRRSTITFTVPNMPPKDPPIDYVVRVRVDGVDSLAVRVVDEVNGQRIRPRLEFDPRQQVRLT